MKNIFYSFKILIISIIDPFFISKGWRDKLNFIVLIKLDNIGDFILWLKSANSIKRKYKSKKILLVCNDSVHNLAKELNLFDEIFSINTILFSKNLFYRFKKLNIISKFLFHKVIHTTYSRDYIVGDSIVRFLNSSVRIGYDCDNFNQSSFHKLISRNWYSKLINSSKETIFEQDRNNEFLKGIGIQVDNKKYVLPVLSNAKNFLINNKYITICPGATEEKRCWSPINFSRLIDILILKYKLSIILCGSKQDIKKSEIIKKYSKTKKIIDFVGKTSLVELIEIIRRSDFTIANDSGPIHISYAVDTPSICISGCNNFGRFIPYPENLRNAPFTIYDKDSYLKNLSSKKFNNCVDKVLVEDVVKLFGKNYKS